MSVVLFDTREPSPHPWQRYLPEGWELERAALDTGDFCLASHPHGAVIERKTPCDMASCIGAGRERFERELKRGAIRRTLRRRRRGQLVRRGRRGSRYPSKCGHWNSGSVVVQVLPFRIRRDRATGGGFRLQALSESAPFLGAPLGKAAAN